MQLVDPERGEMLHREHVPDLDDSVRCAARDERAVGTAGDNDDAVRLVGDEAVARHAAA